MVGPGARTAPAVRSREALPRARRLRLRRDFVAIQGGGRRWSAPHYLLFVSPERPPDGIGRLGITVSAKVGNAVHRNRVKRWIRELYRRLGAGRSHDVVVVARVGAAAAGSASARRELSELVRRAGLGGTAISTAGGA